jgi:hypothetical protein
VALHLVPPASRPGIRTQSEKALAHFIRQHADGHVEQAVLEARTSATPSCARPRRPTWWSWAPRPRRPEQRRRDVPVRGAAGGRRDRSKQDGHRRQDARGDRQGHVRAARARAETLAAAERAAHEARSCRCASSAGSANPTSTTASSATSIAWSTSRSKQGPDREPGPAGPQRGRDDRGHRRAGPARADGAPPARRRAAGHRLRLVRSDARGGGRVGRRARRRPPAGPDTLRQLHAARARRCGRASTRRAATSSSGPTRTSATGIRGWSTARSGRSSPRSGSSTSRATTAGRSSRAAFSRRAAADGSPNWSRGRSSTSSSPSCRA